VPLGIKELSIVENATLPRLADQSRFERLVSPPADKRNKHVFMEEMKKDEEQKIN
jgi:hypothetical protein